MTRRVAGRSVGQTLLLAVCAAALGLMSCGPMVGGGSGGGGGGTGGSATTWVASLSGTQEVPAVVTAATGTATFVLDAAETTLDYTIAQSVSGASAAHVHTGYPGDIGPVTLPFSNVGATMTGQLSVTAAQVLDLKAGHFYVNVHSPAHGGGEIRGQLLAQGAQLFVAPLTGDEEVPRVASSATGFASAILSADRTQVIYHLTTSAEATAAHFHKNLAGLTGPVVVPFTLSGGTANGTAALTAALATDLESGRLYANMHTAAHPGGELRGQLRKPGEQVFVATLSGGQEVPPVTSSNTATVQALADFTAGTLRYEGVTTATVTASHLHAAFGGVSGAVSVPFSVTLSGSATLSGAQGTLLSSGGLYANIHTSANPGGELRGQMLRPGEKLYTAVLSGANEVPPNAATGTGGVQVVLNPAGDHIACGGSFAGLTGTPSGAHLHAAANGAVKVPLAINGSSFGCDAAVSAQDVADLAASAWYANIHTAANPDGELRGTVAPR